MHEIRDRWKGRGHMVDLSVKGRLTKICQEETVNEDVSWINPERDKISQDF